MKINFEAKSDRELLVLVAQSCNDTVDHLTKLNASILKHEKRLIVLEATHCDSSKPWWKINWQILALITSIIGLIVVKVGQTLTWW